MTDQLPRLLLVQADAALRDSLAEQIAAQTGWEVLTAETPEQAIALAAGRQVDLVLADGGPAGTAGPGPRLRQGGLRGALVVFAARESEAQEADVVVSRPFRLGTLVASLRKCLNQFRARRNGDAHPVIGGWRFLVDARILESGEGATIRLTEKEAAILTHLHQAQGRVVGREELLAAVWGYQPHLTTHTVETHVYRLRRKLDAGIGGARALLTEPGGYRLVF